MTPMVAMLLLGGVCWVFRVLFIVLVPAERLPRRCRDALGHLAPAVLAALVAVETGAVVHGDSVSTTGLVVGAVLLIGIAVRLTGSLALAIAAGLATTLVVDLLVLG